MNILFLTLMDFESINERGIYTDLIREFYNKNNYITVISPTEKKGVISLIKQMNITIIKPYIGKIQKTSFFKKGINTILLEYRLLNKIKKQTDQIKYDLIIYSTPPITFYRTVRFIKYRDKAKTYLLLKDIFPQNAVDLKIIRKSSKVFSIYKYFRNKEMKLYQLSDFIGCMSKKNVDYITTHNRLDKQIVEVCPNSIKPLSKEFFYRDNSIIKMKYNIPVNKTVFLYGGNIGKAQAIDFLLKAVKKIEFLNDVFILIIGSGTEFHIVKNFLIKNNIQNTLIIDELPKSEFDKILSSVDVGLILLDYKLTVPNIPSRILSYMEASLPILAATDNSTDLKSIIEDNEIGLWSSSLDLNGFISNIKKLTNVTFRNKLSLNSRNYLELNYTVDISYKIIMKHFEEGELHEK